MIPETGFRAVFAVVCLLTGESTVEPAKTPTPREPDARLSRVLDEWHRRSVDRTSLDLRCTRLDRHSIWGDESYTGRVAILPDGRALVEFVKSDTKDKPAEKERLVWTAEAFHMFRPESKDHFVWPIAAKERGRLPAMLALPFLWHTDVERLKLRYNVEVVKEEADAWVLRFTPLTEAGRLHISKAYLVLDKRAFLPRRYFLVSPDGKSTKDYRMTEARLDQPMPDEILDIHDEKGWKLNKFEGAESGTLKLSSWLGRWLQPDLLP